MAVLSAAAEIQAADQRPVCLVKDELQAAEPLAAEPLAAEALAAEALAAEPLAAEPLAAEVLAAEPACVELGVEVGPGSMESELPAGRCRWPQREVWSVAELLAVLGVGHQPWSLLIRLQLLLL